jgi:hypothetical protein
MMIYIFSIYILFVSFQNWNKRVLEKGNDKLTLFTISLFGGQVVLVFIYFLITIFYSELVNSNFSNIILSSFIIISLIPLIIDWNYRRKLNGLTGESSIFKLVSILLVMVIMVYTSFFLHK